jgi:hypothetical protein
MSSPIEETLFALLAPLAPGKSVGPEDVARAVDPEGWRRMLPRVRAEARGLARLGRIAITRHGKPADPETFKGVYRLRLPMEGDVIAPPKPRASDMDDEDADPDLVQGGDGDLI